MDGALLAEAFSTLRGRTNMRALLVARNGVVVAEEYFNKTDANTLFDVRSVTKSVTSILVGIAVDIGVIKSIDETIDAPLDAVVEAWDPAKRKITIRHLLTMSGGFQWPEFGDWSGYNNWNNAANQVDFIMAIPLVRTPGASFNYNDGACHLLSVILTLKSRMTTQDFAKHYLFSPIGITDSQWLVDKQGYAKGCVGLKITCRDLFKIGELFRQKGVVDGKKVLSSEWIAQSTAPLISTGGVMSSGSSYGYLWWNDVAQGHRIYMATGFGGQFIFCVDDLGLVITSQCEWAINDSQANANWMAIMQAILKQILPAVRR
jgi:CubicO group peptidase (beta-lactamase class C family)